MIEKIQAFTVEGKGIATEAKVEVQSRFTTQNRAILYYDLRDPNGTTPAYDSRISQYVTLPYAILFRSKIILTGDDRAAAISDATLAKNIVFRDRTDIVKDTVDTNTYKYFAVRNMMSKRGSFAGRTLIDGNGYELYQKQSASREGLNNYTFLTSYAGDPVGNPIKDKKGNIIGYDGRQLIYSYGAGIIDVNVTISNTGQKSYIVDANTRGDEFYINLIQPYL
jgi:hypothetical protein